MNYLKIAGEEYPIKYGRKALAAVLKLAGAKSMKDASKIDEIPLNKWANFILCGLSSGAELMDTSPPTLEVIDAALDYDVTLFTLASSFFADDMTPPKVETEGN